MCPTVLQALPQGWSPGKRRVVDLTLKRRLSRNQSQNCIWSKMRKTLTTTVSSLSPLPVALAGLSENAVKQVLSEAKKLRRSDDGTVAASVFINSDRSPAEAKLAFERRQQRREMQWKRSQQATIAVSAASADPVERTTDIHHTVVNSSFRAK